ncbi:MAG: hypothetical protein ACO3G4_03600, partial [Opitutaceae bacterium]
MRNARVSLLLLAVAALAASGVALTPAVQAGLIRYLLRRSFDPAAEVGSARIGWDGGVRVRELRLRTPELGLTVAEAEVRLRPASLFFGEGPEFREVRLRGCVIEPTAPEETAETWREPLRAGLAGALAPARLEAEGEVRWPAAIAGLSFRAVGEGGGAGNDGRLRVGFTFRPPGANLPVVEGGLKVEVPAKAVAAPLRAELEAAVRGEGWPRNLNVVGELTAPTTAGGGAWALRVRTGDREVARCGGVLPPAGADWQLQWWVDFRDGEVARLFPEPRWSGERLVGEGDLRWTPGSGLVAVRGKAEVELGPAARAHPLLARLGLTGGDAEFEFRAGPQVWAFENLAVRLRAGSAAPVLRLSTRQPWAVDWRARAFQAREPEADLIRLEVVDFTLPPWRIDGITVGGGPVRGSLIGRVNAGALALRSEESLRGTGFFAGTDEGRRIEDLALLVQGGLRLAPEGWSAELGEL